MVTLLLSFLFSYALQASCPVALAKEKLDRQEIKNYSSAIIEMTTPFEGASDTVKGLLHLTQKSWLKRGRPDQGDTKDFQTFIDVHHRELAATINELKELQKKPSSHKDNIARFISYSEEVLKELETFSRRSSISQIHWLKWGIKCSWVYEFIHELNRKFSNQAEATKTHIQGLVDEAKSITEASGYPDSRVTALPIFSDFTWRDLNDIWILAITPYTETKSVLSADGRLMPPHAATTHDGGHARTLAPTLPHDIDARLFIFLDNFKLYKKFRALQKQEISDRKRKIREGVWFDFSHERNLTSTQSMREKIKFYNRQMSQKKSQYPLYDPVYQRFLAENDYGGGFKPSVSREEVVEAIDWLFANFQD